VVVPSHCPRSHFPNVLSSLSRPRKIASSLGRGRRVPDAAETGGSRCLHNDLLRSRMRLLHRVSIWAHGPPSQSLHTPRAPAWPFNHATFMLACLRILGTWSKLGLRTQHPHIPRLACFGQNQGIGAESEIGTLQRPCVTVLCSSAPWTR